MEDSRPMGVFDSGIGGLTVLKVLAQRFPRESFIYLGDTARLPYGSKSPSTIRKYSEQNLQFLISQGVKAIVIACGSASSQFPETQFQGVPVYNTIHPGSLRALAFTKNKKIGVLGTRATIQSDAYASELGRLDAVVEVNSQACPLFVPLAEEGWVDDPITNIIAYRYVNPLLQTGIDTLILGCTHYPILKEAIRKVVGWDIELVDSGEAIAELIAQDIEKTRFMDTRADALQKISVLTTDASEHFTKLAKRILEPVVAHEFRVVDI